MTIRRAAPALIALSSVLALSLPLAYAGDSVATTRSGKPIAKAIPEAGIIRFAEIRPGLARGGAPGEAGLHYLKEHGYKTVVSFLTEPAESAWVVQAGMKYVHVPMRSSFFSADTPTKEQIRQFLEIARDSTQFPAYIHCKAGKDRTGAMMAIYRMEVCGWTADEAVDEMKAFGFSSRYGRLMDYVQAYSVAPSSSPTTAASESAPAAAVASP
jgi:protein tyrosine phosphatase (PTP) superfamily phosphohydrolase (DUF442 family)